MRFRRQRAHQAVESLEKCGVFEVLPSGSTAAGGEQPVGVQRDEPTPRPIQQPHAAQDDLVRFHRRSQDGWITRSSAISHLYTIDTLTTADAEGDHGGPTVLATDLMDVVIQGMAIGYRASSRSEDVRCRLFRFRTHWAAR